MVYGSSEALVDFQVRNATVQIETMRGVAFPSGLM